MINIRLFVLQHCVDKSRTFVIRHLSYGFYKCDNGRICHKYFELEGHFQYFQGGGPERMGPRPPPWVPLLKSYGSSILSTSLGSKTLNNTSSLGLGGTKI